MRLERSSIFPLSYPALRKTITKPFRFLLLKHAHIGLEAILKKIGLAPMAYKNSCVCQAEFGSVEFAACEFVELVYEQNAIQVVDFVLRDHGVHFFEFVFCAASVAVDGFDRYGFGAGHVAENARYAQTAFFGFDFGLRHLGDFRIDQGDDFLARGHYDYTLVQTDLRSRDADAIGQDHGLDELIQKILKLFGRDFGHVNLNRPLSDGGFFVGQYLKDVRHIQCIRLAEKCHWVKVQDTHAGQGRQSLDNVLFGSSLWWRNVVNTAIFPGFGAELHGVWP